MPLEDPNNVAEDIHRHGESDDRIRIEHKRDTDIWIASYDDVVGTGIHLIESLIDVLRTMRDHGQKTGYENDLVDEIHRLSDSDDEIRIEHNPDTDNWTATLGAVSENGADPPEALKWARQRLRDQDSQ